MKAFLIPETGDFMRKLLLQSVFDKFELVEGEVATMVTWSIDGSLKKEFFENTGDEEDDAAGTADAGDAAAARTYCLWGDVKPVVYEMIKGKKLPVRFSFVLRLSEENTRWLLEKYQLLSLRDSLSGLFLNIRYQNRKLSCITGLSYKSFVMDKSLDKVWDETAGQFLRQNQIVIEEE